WLRSSIAVRDPLAPPARSGHGAALSVRPSCVRATMGAMPATWPLVGRAKDLANILELLTGGTDEQSDARAGGHGGGAGVVAGDVGVGKSRLASEALAACAAQGFATARVVASRSARSIPFGAIAPLLPPSGEDTGEGLLGVLRAARASLTERA